MNIPKNIERRVRQHLYAKEQDFFAVIQPGFEHTAAGEMCAYGFSQETLEVTGGGIAFRSGVEAMQGLHLRSATLTRVMMRVAVFRVIYFEKLREKVRDIPWELFLLPDTSVEFSVTCRTSRLYHSGRVEQECAAALGERMASVYGEIHGKDVSRIQTIFVRLEDDLCTVSLDCTGEPLYRRGMRTKIGKAPLRETLAACVLRESCAWEFDAVIDPMCGSGAIPIEAALMSGGVLPGAGRSFAFEFWPGHSSKGFAYQKRTLALQQAEHAPRFRVYASDISHEVVSIARQNIDESGLSGAISLTQSDFFNLAGNEFTEQRILLVMNPPYGERIRPDDIRDLYKRIGEKLRADFKGSAYAVIVPESGLENSPVLKPEKRIVFRNGGLKVVLILGRC